MPAPNSEAIFSRVADIQILESFGATANVTVFVNEVNQPPILDSVPGQIINKGILVTIPFVARDSDLPANRLSFSLGSGAPAGASINPTNGVFTWRPGGTSQWPVKRRP